MTTIVPRAKRIPLPIPIAYRRAGEEDWLQSRIHNMSESGVLFGPTSLEPGAQVEVIFSTPTPIGSILPGQLVCIGEVVRATEVGVVGARLGPRRFLLES